MSTRLKFAMSCTSWASGPKRIVRVQVEESLRKRGRFAKQLAAVESGDLVLAGLAGPAI